MCVVWKGNNLTPRHRVPYNHLEAFNDLTMAAMLAAGFAVVDPGAATLANEGVQDTHHHPNIFKHHIFMPLVGSLPRLCGGGVTSSRVGE